MCHASLAYYTALSKAKLQNDLNELQSTRSQTSAETESLKHKFEDIEREKRDLVGVISRLKEEGAQRGGMAHRSFAFHL